MIRRLLLTISVLALLSATMQGCFLKKNKCDTCPSFGKKKSRKH